MLASIKNKDTWKRYLSSLRYALYVIFHPFDGFWDLTHEKRGSLAAANTILAGVLLTRIFGLEFTSFIFNKVYWPTVNIFTYVGSILFILALWCLGNWGLTTLFDGKGKLSQIYMATCYAMTPYILVEVPLIILSNFVTVDEEQFFVTVETVGLIWCAFLIIAAMIQIHEYTVKKTILFTFATIFAMLVLVFILLLFFSMISQGVAYFVSIAKEIGFRN